MKKKQHHYEEYYINETHMKKLYNMYIHQSFFDKILDVLVLFAIIFTVMSIILELLLDVNNSILVIVHSFSIIVLVIFILELMRDYLKSKSAKHFIKHHWIDVILVVFLSLFFVFAYLGFAKVRGIHSLKAYFHEAKEIRVIFSYFSK